MRVFRVFLATFLLIGTVMAQEKGCYFTVKGGGGWQGYEYQAKGLTPDGYNKLLLGWNAGVSLDYYFTKHFGLSIGTGLAKFRSKGGYNTHFDRDLFYDLGMQIDDDFYQNNPNMPFNLRARLQNWSERQTGYVWDIPILLMFQNKWGEKEKNGFYAGIGAKLQIPVFSTKYWVVDAKGQSDPRLNISGYYPDWHMEVAAGGTADPQVPQHGYGSIHNPREALGWEGDMSLKKGVSFVAELGFLRTLNRRVDFTYGVYLDYGLSDVKNGGREDELMVAQNPYHSGYNGEHYIGRGIDYNGLVNSNSTDDVKLLAFGAKIGFRFKCGAIKEYDPIEQPPVILHDTIYIHSKDTIIIIDTVIDCDKDTIYIDKSPDIFGGVIPGREFIMLYASVIDIDSRAALNNSQVQLVNEKTKSVQYLGINTDGYFSAEIEKGIDYTIIANNKGYMENNVELNISKGFRAKAIYKTVELGKLEADKSFILKNILYDFDKHNIRPDAAKELDKLIDLMNEYPNMKIELSSHTDSRGNDNYNMRLSQRRAESAVEYIIKGGISRDRITAKGYGESKLINECGNNVPCSEAKHQENRRTEVLIIEM